MHLSQQPRALVAARLLLLLLLGAVSPALGEAADKSSSASASATTTAAATKVTLPCTATSTAGTFFDLRLDTAVRLEEGDGGEGISGGGNSDAAKAHKKGAPIVDYVARGYDVGYNFTLNICGPLVKPVREFEGVEKAKWANVSAYYSHKGDVFSLGQASTNLLIRGRKLVLQYTDGSPCGADASSRSSISARSPVDITKSTTASSSGRQVHEGASYKSHDYDDESYNAPTAQSSSAKRRKSAIISFQCDPLLAATALSFVGTDPDECAYVFEARSAHACAGVADLPRAPGSVGPGSVFAIIFLIAVLVYVVGGVFYQRTVAHARGWRQLPNYSLWSGIGVFLRDVFVIATSSCARFLPSRRGYRTISISPNGRSRNRDDENRLIDQLDEEWDD